MTIEQITKELKYGDYNTLGEMLGNFSINFC